MRSVLIDPTVKVVEVLDIPSMRSATIRFFSERPTPVQRLPRGDVVLAAKSASGDAFVLGGAGPIAGPGLIVGPGIGAGERACAVVDAVHVAQMVRWAQIENPEVLETVRAIEIDPERRSIELISIAPTMLAVQHRLAGEITVCYQTPDGDIVLGRSGATDPYEWQKDDAIFRGRCIVIGHDARKRLVDVGVPLAKLKEDILFRW